MDRTLGSIVAITIVILAGAIIFASRSADSTNLTTIDDPNRPVATLSEPTFDFGAMTVTEERERTVTVTNTGASPLSIGPASTSCDCTFARIVMPDGDTSPEFSMHGHDTWSGSLAPGEMAAVTVIYRPAVMPVQGRVERAVLIQTNDPVNPNLRISLTANVQ